MKKFKWRIAGVFVIASLLAGCLEPFEAETQSFEDVLVVDGLLTTEVKRHRVRLSRSFAFEAEGSQPENGATVEIQDDLGNIFSFEETAPGIYETTSSFGAIPGVSYQLSITSNSGRVYTSEPVQTPENVPIASLEAVRDTNDLGVQGVKIFLNNNSAPGDPNYFRYEYEETYKIIAPDWDPFEFEIIHDDPCGAGFEVGIKVRTEEQRVCYNTVRSVTPIQTATVALSGNEISNLLIRFLNRDNYIISHRYSILVTQYSQTEEAYAFYQDLTNFSSSEDVFSQIQPGFFEGNLQSRNSQEMVLGYFEVTAVSRQRLYFNYADLFPNEPLPPYAISCEVIGKPPLFPEGYHCSGDICDGVCDSPLIEAIKAELVTYISENENYIDEAIALGGLSQSGPYFTKPAPCGDCTQLGSNIVPDFWEE